MNPAFEIGRQTANTMSRAFTQREDTNAIESILSEAMQSGDPQVIQNSIGKILSQVSPERQGTAIQYLQNTFQNIQAKQEKERTRAAASKEGIDPDLPPELQKEKYKNELQRKTLRDIGTGNVFGQPGASVEVPNENAPPQLQRGQPPMLPLTSASTQQNQENVQSQSQPKGLRALSDDQLTALLSVKPYSESAKAILQERQDQKKIEADIAKQNRKEQLEFHKESDAYYNKILDQSDNAKRQISALNQVVDDLKSGKINPNSLANFFKGTGEFGNKISDYFLSPEESKLQTIVPYLLEGWKDVFGVRLSDADLRILEQKLPSIAKSPEANYQVVKIIQKYAKQAVAKGKIANEIVSQNNGLRPLGFRQMIDERMEKANQPVNIIRPKKNPTDPDVIISIPAFELGDALLGGASLAQ